MAEVNITDSFEEFVAKVAELHDFVERARKKRVAEYQAMGRKVPHRIKFEELDLSAHKIEMLGVQKTLQWRGHNRSLGINAQKARVVAIAGICEVIKDEFVGKFWDLYRKYIGWSADQIVYNWILARGFRKEGIELIRSPWGWSKRREFVQSLVLESGVPKNRSKDLVDFFIHYWRYLRHYDDIENLIEAIAENKIGLEHIPKWDQLTLRRICQGAVDFSRAFSIVVNKLSIVFKFIESSEEIIGGDLEEYVQFIYDGCGIDPLEIVRDKHQLKKLYGRILGLVTPEKLHRLLKSQWPGVKISIPSGNNVRVDHYDHIMFGEHLLKGVKFSCVPSILYSLLNLQDMPFDKVIRHGNGIMLKSKSQIEAIINGMYRDDLVRDFYTLSEKGKAIFEGSVFYTEIQPAMRVELSTANGLLHEFIRELDGAHCSPYLQYYKDRKENKHSLAISVSGFRIQSRELAGKEVALISDLADDPELVLRLDEHGLGICHNHSIVVQTPCEGPIKFYAVRHPSMKPITLNGIDVQYEIQLTAAMLFSPISHRHFPVRQKGDSIRFGGKRFVLFMSQSLDQDSFEVKNLNVKEEGHCGEYRIIALKWEDTSKECFISVDSIQWRFESCLYFNLFLAKIMHRTIEFIMFNERQGLSPNEFQLAVSPIPPRNMEDDLLWNVVVNDGTPFQIKFNRGPKGISEGNTIRLSGKDIAGLLNTGWNEKIAGNAVVEISLCTSEMILDSVKFWLLPELQVFPPESLQEGDEVKVEVQIDGVGTRQEVILKDKIGRSKASLHLTVSDGQWSVSAVKYSGSLRLETLGTVVNFELVPTVHGIRFGSRITEKIETAKSFLRRHLGDLDVIIVNNDKRWPLTYVNSKKCNLTFQKYHTLMSASLDQLMSIVRNKENNVSIISGKQKSDFVILYRFRVEYVDIHESLLDNYIVGKMSYTGPIGSGLRFIVFASEPSQNQLEICRYDIVCDGKDHVNSDFYINLKQTFNRDEVKILVKLYLLSDIADESSAHEFGEVWSIRVLDEVKTQNYEYLKSTALSFYESGQYFTSLRFLTLAKKVSPNHEQKWIDGFLINIKVCIKHFQINSIAAQTRKVLRKEYFLDI